MCRQTVVSPGCSNLFLWFSVEQSKLSAHIVLALSIEGDVGVLSLCSSKPSNADTEDFEVGFESFIWFLE